MPARRTCTRRSASCAHSSRRSSRSPTAPAGRRAEKTIEIVKRIKRRVRAGGDGALHLCRRDRAGTARRRSTRCSRPASKTCSRCAATRPPGQAEWRRTEGGLEYSRELVELISAVYPFAIGAACFPETHIHAVSPEEDLEHLAEKVAAGVDFLITQLFFDNARYFDFVERARAAGITVPIIPGIMPITQVGQVERMAAMCGASIPPALHRELHARGEDPEAVLDFGVAYATLQCAELLAAGAPGIHFYTLNRSPATRAIVSALKLARPWENTLYAGSISKPSATRGEPSAAS